MVTQHIFHVPWVKLCTQDLLQRFRNVACQSSGILSPLTLTPHPRPWCSPLHHFIPPAVFKRENNTWAHNCFKNIPVFLGQYMYNIHLFYNNIFYWYRSLTDFWMMSRQYLLLERLPKMWISGVFVLVPTQHYHNLSNPQVHLAIHILHILITHPFISFTPLY